MKVLGMMVFRAVDPNPPDASERRDGHSSMFAAGRMAWLALAASGFLVALPAQAQDNELAALKARQAEAAKKAADAAVDAELAAAEAALLDAQVRVAEAKARKQVAVADPSAAPPSVAPTKQVASVVATSNQSPPLLPPAPRPAGGPSPSASKEEKNRIAPLEEKENEEDKKRRIEDLSKNFGVGAAVIVLDRPHIKKAILTNDRMVVVTDQTKHRVSAWLEAHYVFDAWCFKKLFTFGEKSCADAWVYPGFFVGLGQGADGDFGNTVGIGGLITFRRKTKGNSINLGIGYYKTKYTTLADGIEANKTLPVGFNDVQLKDKSADGLMFNISFGFE